MKSALRRPRPDRRRLASSPFDARRQGRRFAAGSLPPEPGFAPPLPTPPGPLLEIRRAGLVALVGRTNVGKSSLLNALVGTKISIVTPKPQTTRDAIHGVVRRGDAQFVLVDTPGFFRTRKSRLVDRLHERAKTALEGIDGVVHVGDPSRPIGDEDEMVLAALEATSCPRVLCLNKADLPLRRRPHRGAWLARSHRYAISVDTSARTGTGLERLLESLAPFLPLGPALYGEDEITNSHRDFRITEAIREQVYLLTDAEVPYRTAIELDQVEERSSRAGKPFLHVKAAILVAAERYKGMLVGTGGRMVREIGTAARSSLETILGRQVFLDLAVLVDPALDF